MSAIPTSTHRSGSVALASVGVALLLAPATVVAQSPDRIELPLAWQGEGITTDGSSLYAGSLADGAIWKGDPATGIGDVLVSGAEGAVSVGLDFEADAGRLWAAGGPTGEVRAYDSTSGELLETYAFQGGFLNDVAVTPDAVYITDSFVPQVLVVPLGEDGSLSAPEDAFALPIGGELEYGEGFNLNGIVATGAGLVSVHSPTGELYRIDPASGEATRIDTTAIDLTAGDGLELDGDTLYVVRNAANLVVALELNGDVSAATAVGEFSSDDFDVPTTAALIGDDLWAINARFGTDATPDTEYWITRVDTGATAEVEDQALSLSSRPGSAPSVTQGVPHIQQDQTSSPEVMDALAIWAFSLPSIVELPSAASLPGARAFTLTDDLEANEDAMIVGREFGHIHANPGAGSLHLRLPEDEASAVIDAGWGVWHPFALEGSMPGLIMVFAPRDADDLEVIKLIVDASVEYAGS
jgi:sugar lactone lactonase YvrE